MRNDGIPSTNGEPSVSGGMNDMSMSSIRMSRGCERHIRGSITVLPLSENSFAWCSDMTDHENNNVSMLWWSRGMRQVFPSHRYRMSDPVDTFMIAPIDSTRRYPCHLSLHWKFLTFTERIGCLFRIHSLYSRQTLESICLTNLSSVTLRQDGISS